MMQAYHCFLPEGLGQSCRRNRRQLERIMSSMFGSLAARFAPSAENLATEALAYILQSSAARKALNEMASILCPGVGEARTFRTQNTGEDQAIPDLAGFDHSGRAILLIENKFWAGLTPNQPTTYLKRLADDQPGLVLFVVPPRRLHAIWPDLATSADRAGLRLPSSPGTVAANALSGQVGSRTLAVTTWQALLERIAEHASASGEAATVSDVGQLRGLCEAMNSTGYIPATQEELTNVEIPRRLLGLGELVQQACDRAVAAGIADARKLRPTHYWYGAGRFLRIGAAGAWVGIDHRLWALHGIGPLWATFSRTDFGRAREVLDAIGPWLSSSPVRAFDWEGAAAVPLRILPQATRDVVLDNLYDQIVQLHDLLKAIPGTGDATPPEPAEEVR